MASSPFAFRLYQTLLQKRRSSRGGFTLTELLVSIVIAGIIISSLLFLVVEMLRADQSEAVLNQTQQDVNNAMDYISRELQEAVFVYPSQADMDAITNQLTDLPRGGSFPPTPVVAFWRIDPVDNAALKTLRTNSSNCTTGDIAFRANCELVSLRQSTYTLVVYLRQGNDPNGIWAGDARILRYEFPQFRNLTTLEERTGFTDPAPSNFEAPTVANGNQGWKIKAGATTTEGNPPAVLVDSIDANTPPASLPGLPACDTAAGYQRIPSDPTVTSFFVCVRDPVLSTDEELALSIELGDEEVARNNQDLIVYLRGNATSNRAGLFTTYNENSRLPTLESRILVRGILDKRP
ncbi:prepilin-type N-terminal cleavage/methylation domain-containing protein [Pseudanabaena sp. FACHB-2040]|uniref:PilW family protein n=1 Tax=Pseudanabaena sp. FACHB-2040 TaxID=2692859 RepID=UPI001684EB2D|nr:prepilin-type N-terminal cleavage/methylation domain-containing protein [Pseudanabaena sp. FACHB-2040]MBD2258569.1 prepilin-type N-terminal cleavage/methylation domain-containing protein [Pseudanabaena sp. FACHB-2040]